jgi:putative Holliday junction resolvase
MALDVGERRTGVAMSDPTGCLATPLTVLRCPSREAEMEAVAELAQKHTVGRVIVGYPRSLNGTVGPQAERVDRYVDKLRTYLQIPVATWDERLSTAQAERLVHDSGKRVRRDTIDAAAAAVILQSYLDAEALRSLPQPPPG